MMVVKDANAALYETPPGLIVAARSCWLNRQGSAAMLPPGETQVDVQRCLGAMGVPFSAGVMGDEGLFPLKLALPDRCVFTARVTPSQCAAGVQRTPAPAPASLAPYATPAPRH